MITVTGKIEDATGAPLHAQIDFTSKSTPLVGSGGIVTTNTDDSIKSDPSTGNFSVTLAPGNYTVTTSANGESTTFNIAVPAGNSSVTIDTLVSTPLAYPFIAPNQVWDGTAQNITFEPLANPAAVTTAQVTYAGGNISNTGTQFYSYFVSYVTASGQTGLSPQTALEYGPATANQATRVFLTPNVTGVTAINIWRTCTDNGHTYQPSLLPTHVGLLATVSPTAAYYDDWEDTAQFAARLTADVPPLYNTTAGQLLSSSGTPAAYVNDTGLFIPGANCRFKPGVGFQIYNFDTSLWHTVLCQGNPAQLALDAGNPN